MLTKKLPFGLSGGDEDPQLSGGWDLVRLSAVVSELTAIREAQRAGELASAADLERIPFERRASARNLLHYLALRSRDIRDLQESLAALGLSSMGRAEGHAMWTVDVLLKHLHHLVHHRWQVPPGAEDLVSRVEARRLLQGRAEALLGPRPAGRSTRIMVTLPSEASRDYAFIRDLVAGGADALRINCAHDGPGEWGRMVEHVRRARRELGRPCVVLMDLAGPKIRTGRLAPGPQVLRWKPSRDAYGRPSAPVRIWLTPKEAPEPPLGAEPVLPLSGAWLADLHLGDHLRFIDARGAKRTLEVVGGSAASRWALSYQSAYVRSGMLLTRIDARGRESVPEAVGELRGREEPLRLKTGDRLLLTISQEPGGPGSPARISCTLPEALGSVRPGDLVRFDDGKISGRAVETRPEGLLVEILEAGPKGARLAADKGINFPDSRLSVPSLTEKDVEDLAFVARHADLVGYSFVRTPEDVRELRRRLQEVDGTRVGILLKIETRETFANLPKLLLAALEGPAAGVMIARGDLAVECGFERLAELQEEILWLCEAAHLPVVWATQVLETLAKEGRPSRAEITDAAMGERAECVMLNKGPYILRAVGVLEDIIRRMEEHQSKKTALLRPLSVAASAAP